MKKYWKSVEEFQGITAGDDSINEVEQKNQVLALLEDDFLKKNASRRDFLKVFGFSLSSAAIIASCKRPVQTAIPYIIQPPEVTPGKSVYYATSYFDGHEYSGILIKTRDGRPIKVEGNILSSFNKEGTSARVQASVLSLYDDARLKSPTEGNSPAHGKPLTRKLLKILKKLIQRMVK